MSDSPPIDTQKAKSAIDELMKTAEGQALADKIRDKLKDLNVQFKGLSQDDKKKFVDEFKGKFSETFEDLKSSLKMRMVDDSSDFEAVEEAENIPIDDFRYSTSPNYTLFLIAFIIVLVVFG
jgi:uncharacterized protein (UPF0305 family)